MNGVYFRSVLCLHDLHSNNLRFTVHGLTEVPSKYPTQGTQSDYFLGGKGNGKVRPFTGTKALYRP